MVFLWSFAPSAWETAVITSSMGIFIYLLYTHVVGWFDDPSLSIFQKLGLKTVRLSRKRGLSLESPELAPHFKMRLYTESAIVVVLVTYLLSLIVFPAAYSHGAFYALFMYRQTPDAAHGSSYILILVLAIIATIKWDDALKGILYAGLMAFVHEGMWYPFYYIDNWNDINIPADAGFIVLITSIAVVAWRKYHIKISLKSLSPYLGFLLGWFAIGFPLTTVNSASGFFMTRFYLDPTVNVIEVVSWMIIFGVFLWNLRNNEPHGWKWLDSNLKSQRKRDSDDMDRASLGRRGRPSQSHRSSPSPVHVVMVVLLLLFSFVAVIPEVPAHAYSVPNTSTLIWVDSLTGSVGFTVEHAGDLIIVNAQIIDPTSAGHTDVYITGMEDTQGNHYSVAAAEQWNFPANCEAGNCFDDEIWSAIASSSGPDTLTVTISQSSASGQDTLEVVDVAGNMGDSLIGVSFGSGSEGDNYATSPSIPITGGFADASIFSGCQSTGTISAGTNFILIQPYQNPDDEGSGAAEFGDPSMLPSSPSDFPSGCSAVSNWMDVGVVFGVAPSSVLLIVPPSIYSLNYWLFPILFLGLYDGFYLGEGMLAKVSTKGLTYLLIGGFLIGSLLGVIMGMLDYELPLISLVGFFIYLFRIKG